MFATGHHAQVIRVLDILPDLKEQYFSRNKGHSIKHGQLHVFIPNYYRGTYFQFPDTAGKSSQLFNTATVAWFSRCVILELCDLKGCSKGSVISPKLPKH
ncbi:hypothetical protein [Shewanella aestuarii]|uniref:Uncharacterized protein n=1 Tax=Shewanella aestuarii TaxID=1028752 RepID=A0A6G9QMW1_9GAMM|nr:hypothetical protein [Shewanella aestuarii]QIR15179.1 hypothetical protein HBH39_12345 [Shewanella aestuarii]